MAHNPFPNLSNKTIKMRSFFLFSLLVAAASAFVAPANQAVGKFDFWIEDSVEEAEWWASWSRWRNQLMRSEAMQYGLENKKSCCTPENDLIGHYDAVYDQVVDSWIDG